MLVKKVLITGALGMLGKALIKEYLSTNSIDTLILLDVLPDAEYEKFKNSLGKVRNEIRYLQVDVLDSNVLQRVVKECSIIFHLAGVISYSREMRQKMQEVNVKGTELITRIAEQSGVQKIIYASSISAVALLNDAFATELDYPSIDANYMTVYSQTKLESERIFFLNNSSTCIKIAANLGVILGVNAQMRQLVGSMRRMPLIPLLPTYNSYIDARDAANALLFLSQSGVKNERYIVTAYNITNGEILLELTKIIGRKPIFLRLPYAFLKLVHFLISRILGNFLSTDAWKSMAANKRFSTAKIQALGWRPKYSLRDSLKNLIAML